MDGGAVTGGGSAAFAAGERLTTGTAKSHDVRAANIIAAKGVADAVRTSLGPKGMDKMIQSKDGEVLITNDGATIMSQMQVFHPTAKMLVELSKSQDIEAGDGTTSVVVLCGSLLDKAASLIEKGIHPTVVGEAFGLAVEHAVTVLQSVAVPVDLSDRDSIIKAATTSLSSKVVSAAAEDLAPLAVDAVLGVLETHDTTATGGAATGGSGSGDAGAASSSSSAAAPSSPDVSVDLNNIKVVKALGGTIDETELVEGLVFTNKISHVAGAPTRVANAKIALFQGHLSAPKADIENQVVVSEYSQMDRMLDQERKHILAMVKKIAATGCNVLLVQKSILRDALNDLSLHYLARMKILVVRDVERDDVESISKTLGCLPIAHIDSFTPDKLGSAELVEEVDVGGGTKVTKITGVKHPRRTISLLIRGSNKLVLDETDRSIHDALCVVRSLVKKRFLIAGGGAPEIEMALALTAWSKTLTGMHAVCVREFADALEIIPYTLAENAGMNPIAIVTELRKRHAEGGKTAGINVKRGVISDILEENVLQPLLVSTSAITLATETVRMILKIDDMVAVR